MYVAPPTDNRSNVRDSAGFMKNEMSEAAARTKTQLICSTAKNASIKPTMTNIRRTLSTSIEPGDEHLVRLSDGIFLGLNRAASAGSFGELQTQSFMNKPIFVWMTDKEWFLGPTEEEKYGGFSMWSFPHLSKLARNEKEMKILVGTIMNNV